MTEKRKKEICERMGLSYWDTDIRPAEWAIMDELLEIKDAINRLPQRRSAGGGPL